MLRRLQDVSSDEKDTKDGKMLLNMSDSLWRWGKDG